MKRSMMKREWRIKGHVFFFALLGILMSNDLHRNVFCLSMFAFVTIWL